MSSRRIAVALLLTATALGACAGSRPAQLVTPPGFQPGVMPTCLLHQTDQPDGAYAGGPDAKALPQLTFLAYFTAAGRKPFCDGMPATDQDKAWAHLYADLTQNPGKVTTVLG